MSVACWFAVCCLCVVAIAVCLSFVLVRCRRFVVCFMCGCVLLCVVRCMVSVVRVGLLLFGVRCVLFVGYSLFVARCGMFVVRRCLLLLVVRGLLYVVRRVLFVVCSLVLFAVCCLLLCKVVRSSVRVVRCLL